MTYELALQLKEAGFPQLLNEKLDLKEGRTHEKTVYYPTLEELIEACGDKFRSVAHDESTEATKTGLVWFATWTRPHSMTMWKGYERGSTPTEAVAKLWIALQTGKHTEYS